MSGRVVTWSTPTRVDDIRWVSLRSGGIPGSEVDALERALGARMPDGYREYVGRFGAAVDCVLARVCAPERVRSDLETWRDRIREFWFWGAHDDGFDQSVALRSICIADTMNGEELVVRPDRPGSIYVLPHSSEQSIRIDGDLLAALSWLCESGEIVAPCAVRYAEPLLGRKHRSLRGDVPAERIVEALRALEPGTIAFDSDDDDGGTTVLLEGAGVSLMALPTGTVMISLDDDEPAPARQVLDTLATLGLKGA